MRFLLVLGFISYALALPCAAQSQDRTALVTREAKDLQTIAREPSHKLVLWLGDGAPFQEHRDLFDKAFAACRQALRASPNNAAVRANLGALYLWRDALHRDESGNFEKAIDQFLIVLSNDPSNEAALTYLRAYEVLTRVRPQMGEKGMESIRSALQRTLKDPPPVANLRTFARVMFFDGRMIEARTAAKALTELSPIASSQLLLGSVELKSSHADKALAAFQIALKLTHDPVEVATAKLGAAQAYKALGHTDAADRMLAEAIGALPPPALEHAARVAGLDTLAEWGWSIGWAYAAAGNFVKALDFLAIKEVNELLTKMATQKNNEGAELFDANDLLGARNAFLVATELIPVKAVYWGNLASVSFKMGRYQECVMASRKRSALESLDFRDAGAYRLALSYAVLGNYKNARATFEKAARDFPGEREAFAKWAVVLAYAVGGWDEAVKTWSRLVLHGGVVRWQDYYGIFENVLGGMREIAERAEKQGARYQSLRHESVLYNILSEGLKRSLLNAKGIKMATDEREETMNKIIGNYRRLPLKPVIASDVQELVQKAQSFVDSAFDNQESARKAVDLYKQVVERAPWWPEGHYTLALLAACCSRVGGDDYDGGRWVWMPEREMNTYLALIPEGPDAARARQMLEGFRRTRITLGPDIER